MTHRPDPHHAPDGVALDAVDPRLLAELGFARRLAEPPPWIRELVALGEVVNGLLPLMSDWMSRWSAALSYDDADTPLVHARWVAPEAEPVEASPPTVRARVAAPAAHHSVRVYERQASHVIERVPVTGAPVAPGDRGVRPVVAAAEGRGEAYGDGRVRRPSTAGRSPASGPADTGRLPVVHGRVPPSGMPSDMPSGMASVASVASVAAQPSPSTPPAVAASDGGPATPRVSFDASFVPSGVPYVSSDDTGRAPSMPPGAAGVPPAVSPTGEGMPSAGMPSVTADRPTMPAPEALVMLESPAPATPTGHPSPGAAPASASAPADRTRPASPGAPTAVADPAEAAPAMARTHPRGAPVDIAALQAMVDGGARVVARGVRQGRPEHLDRGAARPVTAGAPVAPTRPAATPAGTASRPVVRAHAAPSTVDARPAVPVVRGHGAQMPPAVAVGHPSPAPQPTPQGVPQASPAGRMVPVAPPRSAEELARMLGGGAPQAAPVSPTPAAATAAAAESRPVVLAPEQIRTIAGVVQQRVMRHIEQERARTRTRV